MDGIETTSPEPDAAPSRSGHPGHSGGPDRKRCRSRWWTASPSPICPRTSTFRRMRSKIFLEAFEGPLDLLLYLVKRQNLDILDIPIASDHAAVHGVHRSDEGASGSSSPRSISRWPRCWPRSSPACCYRGPRASMTKRTRGPSSCAGCGSTNGTSKRRSKSTELPRVGRDLLEVRTATPYVRIERPQPRIETRRSPRGAHRGARPRADVPAPPGADGVVVGPRAHVDRAGARTSGRDFVEFTALFTPQRGPAGGRRDPARAARAASGIAHRSSCRREPFGPVHVRATRGDESPRRGGGRMIKDDLVLHVEAALLSAGRPVAVDELHRDVRVCREDAPDRSAIRDAVAALADAVAWTLARGERRSRADIAPKSARSSRSRSPRCGRNGRRAIRRALLETLALIAYRQPDQPRRDRGGPRSECVELHHEDPDRARMGTCRRSPRGAGPAGALRNDEAFSRHVQPEGSGGPAAARGAERSRRPASGSVQPSSWSSRSPWPERWSRGGEWRR